MALRDAKSSQSPRFNANQIEAGVGSLVYVVRRENSENVRRAGEPTR